MQGVVFDVYSKPSFGALIHDLPLLQANAEAELLARIREPIEKVP